MSRLGFNRALTITGTPTARSGGFIVITTLQGYPPKVIIASERPVLIARATFTLLRTTLSSWTTLSTHKLLSPKILSTNHLPTDPNPATHISLKLGSLASSDMSGMPPPFCILSAIRRILGLDIILSRPPLAIICWALESLMSKLPSIVSHNDSHGHHLWVPHHRSEVWSSTTATTSTAAHQSRQSTEIRHATATSSTSSASAAASHPSHQSSQSTEVGHTASATARWHLSVRNRCRSGILLPRFGGSQGCLHVGIVGVELQACLISLYGSGEVAKREFRVSETLSSGVFPYFPCYQLTLVSNSLWRTWSRSRSLSSHHRRLSGARSDLPMRPLGCCSRRGWFRHIR